MGLDSDLYKTLNQHYNRNNHIAVPPEFRDVVEATLREFFLSVQVRGEMDALFLSETEGVGKDSERRCFNRSRNCVRS